MCSSKVDLHDLGVRVPVGVPRSHKITTPFHRDAIQIEVVFREVSTSVSLGCDHSKSTDDLSKRARPAGISAMGMTSSYQWQRASEYQLRLELMKVSETFVA